MARATQSQAPEDLWHLSIDDLFASPAQAGAGAVAGPFVINLSLSSAPSGAMPRGMPRFERLCIYQLKNTVDEHRDEFRLRLGIIETELEADAILAAIREHYPAARKETASEEDAGAVALRVARARKRAEQVKRAEAKATPPKPSAKQPARQPSMPAAPKRDVMLRANATSPVPATAAPSVAWNLDDVLPQFAAHAPFKYEATAPVPASARGVAAVTAAAVAAAAAAAAAAKSKVNAATPVTSPPAVAPPAIEAPLLAAPVAAAPLAAAPVVAEPVAEPVAETLEIAAPIEVAQVDVVAETAFEFTAESDAEPSPVETLEFEPEPPAMAIAPMRSDSAAHGDIDSNAITVEVEALTFTIEAPHLQLEVDAPKPIAATAAAASPPVLMPPAVAPVVAAPLVLEEPIVVTPVTIVAREAIVQPLPADDVVELLEALPPVADSPAESPSISDSGSLEKLVAKIDSLVDEVSTSASSETVSMDSTITERALTQLDLSAEDEATPCFVVQLILSEQQINPDQVPSLDIYSEYRLYRITGFDQGHVKHALRLGFFSSEPAAQAVAGYLAIFFDSPTITRVSVAERERFEENRLAAGKDVGATGTHSTIELTSPTPLPARRERESVPAPQDRAKSSLWSRIVAPLKR